jgi:hypothetical protein
MPYFQERKVLTLSLGGCDTVVRVNGQLRYGPPRATVPALVLLAVLIALFAISSDTSGRIAGVAAVVLLLLAAAWVSRGPAVVADDAGIAVRGLIAVRRHPWPQVRQLRLESRRRSKAIEVETDDGVFAIPAYLLGRVTLAQAERELSLLRTTALLRSPDELP